jgi:cytochrome c oxidase cbb3-type subunit 2
MPETHRKLERNAIGFVLAIIGVSAIGGLVEIAPLFTIHETVETAKDMRVYTPLEVAGRNIYIREGCYACHSQMIRTLRDEVERYGPYSLAVESKYDHPMLWGSKRTGPDLARLGNKYSDAWHVAHLTNPRHVVPQSVMPRYGWLMRNELRIDDAGQHLAALRMVGVPYTDEMLANATKDAYGQRSGGGRHAALWRGDQCAFLRRRARSSDGDGCPRRLSSGPGPPHGRGVQASFIGKGVARWTMTPSSAFRKAGGFSTWSV